MDFIWQFFSLTVDPASWLESPATFAVITLITVGVFLIGWFGVLGRRSRSEALIPLFSGLVIAIMNCAGQLGWFPEALTLGRAQGLWFCAAAIVLFTAFLPTAGRRIERDGDVFIGRLTSYASLLFVFQAAMMAMQAWNDMTLVAYAACLQGTVCDAQSASDPIMAMPLWLLILLVGTGVAFLVLPLFGRKAARGKDENSEATAPSTPAAAEETPDVSPLIAVASPLLMVASPLIAPRDDNRG